MAEIERRNNFGFLRLFFAMCVLVSHSFELVDGNQSREPFTAIFGGGMTLGGFGVSGFFIVSGYLIAQSFENSASIWSYLYKRILRIYPGFIACFIICILIVAPLAGGHIATWTGSDWLKQIAHILLLDQPWVSGSFSSLHYPSLNGSMWTIPYEFRCYLLLPIILACGLSKRRALFAFLVFMLLIATTLCRSGEWRHISLHETLRLTGLFLAGSSFYIFREFISYRTDVAVLFCITVIVCLFWQTSADLAIPTLGAYLVFWFAFLKNTPRLNTINNKSDISYGIYLYAWPIQSLSIKFIPHISPLLVITITMIGASAMALASWFWVEKPARFRPAHAPAQSSPSDADPAPGVTWS